MTAAATRERVVKVFREDMNRMRGKLFMAVEAAGLPERQEDALKGLIRQVSYQAQADVEAEFRKEL